MSMGRGERCCHVGSLRGPEMTTSEQKVVLTNLCLTRFSSSKSVTNQV